MNKILFFFLLFLCSYINESAAQTNYDYFISNSGSDSNAGTSKLLPRRTIVGTAALLANFSTANGSVNVGLESGSVFNEAMIPSSSMQVGSYTNNYTQPDFTILNGTERCDTGWRQMPGSLHTYQQDIRYTGFTGTAIIIGNYNYIEVVEIDRTLEQTHPLTARRILQFAPSVQAVDSIPGSFYEPLTTLTVINNLINISIHSTNNTAPNANVKYRYEITVRDRAVDSYRFDNNKFENLWVRGYGAGYGSLPGGANSYYHTVIFGPGAAIHHVVTKNATLNNCLFLPGAKNTNGGALIFYDVQGFGRHNLICNSIFLDIKTPIYAHTSNGTNHGAIEADGVIAFADTLENGGFISAANTDSILINKIYIDNYSVGYNNASAKYVNIQSSYFKDVGLGMLFPVSPVKAMVNNAYVRSKAKSNGGAIIMGTNCFVTLSNSIVEIVNTNSLPNGNRAGFFIYGSGGAANHISATSNIFISDVDSAKAVTAATTNTNAGIGTSSDTWSNNVYILLKGSKMFWTATNAATTGGNATISSFSEWQRQSGQDKNSLFFDLRNDPRGLQAIFLDPDNGNYELANTVEGNQVKALGAGMTTPLPCFLKKPTYEEAAEMIRTEKVPTVNSCRNPCQQAKAKVSFSVTPDAAGIINICQDNEVTLTASGSYLQNDTYYHQSDAKQRYLWWSSDGEDTMGTNLHTLTRTFSKPGSTDVRLQMVDENGCSYDTIFTVKVNPLPEKPDLGKDTSLCTGQTLQLGVINKQATDVYSWSTGISGKGEINITKAGTYAVQSENSLGCQISDTIEVLNKTPITISLGTDTMYCSSSPNLLTTVTTGLVKGYQWNTGAVTDTFRISSAGTYIVTAKDFGVCMASDTITLIENPVNLFSLPGDTTICEGTTYQLSLTPSPATSITWSDGTTSYTHQIQEGIYSVTASNAGCVKKDEIGVSIQRLPIVNLGKDITLCSGYDLPLSVHYPGASFIWNTGSMDSSIIARDGGTYWVQTTLNGCSYRDSMELNLESCNCTIRMPNAFSPNGDGINDVVRASVECFPEAFNLSIFDRYGHLVYSSKDYRGFWDGNFNGKPQPVGTYYYILSFRNESLQQSKPFSGSLTLLR